MTLDEAIKHAEEVAKEHERGLKVYENINEDRPLFKEEENECRKCAKEHRQLAEWLKELKQLREQTDDSCLNFDFDKVKEFLKRGDFDNLIVDHTCEDKNRTDEEIKLGDEVIGYFGAKGVVVGIDTYEGEVLLALLMRNHKVPQLVKLSWYKAKTGRYFPQIMEVLEQMKGESDGK